jgi:hypothetical protein
VVESAFKEVMMFLDEVNGMVKAWNEAVSTMNPHWRFYTEWVSFLIVIYLEKFRMQSKEEF